MISIDTTPIYDIGGRCNGKTMRLIRRASMEDLYIVVRNRDKAMQLAKMARDMGVDILFPIVLSELPMKVRGNAYRMTHPGMLVNDMDGILQEIIGMPVVGATSYGKVLGRDLYHTDVFEWDKCNPLVQEPQTERL